MTRSKCASEFPEDEAQSSRPSPSAPFQVKEKTITRANLRRSKRQGQQITPARLPEPTGTSLPAKSHGGAAPTRLSPILEMHSTSKETVVPRRLAGAKPSPPKPPPPCEYFMSEAPVPLLHRIWDLSQAMGPSSYGRPIRRKIPPDLRLVRREAPLGSPTPPATA